MLNYSKILNNIEEYNPEIIYFPVGCSMQRYEEKDISSENNQQNPLFMEKYKKKCCIFMDPELEIPLKLETQINLNNLDNLDNYRLLKNENYLVFAINTYFSYEDGNIFLLSLIEYVLSYNKKLIIQDYTGRDISKIYTNLFNIFPKKMLIKKVMFDITQNDGGCCINFNNNPVYYDTENNFIQPRFLTLIQITKNNVYFKNIILKRMNVITYELCRYLRILNNEIEYSIQSTENIENIFNYLSMIYDFENIINLDNIKNVIILLIQDIINSLDCFIDTIDTIDTIKNSNYNQSVIINYISKLKKCIN